MASTLSAVLVSVAALCSAARAQDAPQNFQATVVTSTSINLTWDPPADSVNISYYDVEYSQSTFSEIPKFYSINTEGLETELLLENLEEYVEYLIMVRVVSGQTFLSFSPTLSVTTLQDAPSAPPNNLTVETISSDQLSLSWQPPPAIDINGQLTHYIIRYRTIPASVDILTVVSGSTHTRNLTGLAPFTTYTVQVAAFTMEVGPYRVGMGTTSEDVPGGPPSEVHGYSNSSTAIVVEWEPPIPELLHGILRNYVVHYGPSNSSVERRTDQVEPGQTLHLLSGLQPSTNYSVQVAAVTVGVGPYSPAIYIVTQPIPPVKDPCLTLSDIELYSTKLPNSSSSVLLIVSWSTEGTDVEGCTHSYNLSYSADQSPPYPSERRQMATETMILPGNRTNYTLNSALPFAEYTVVVHAFDREEVGERLQRAIRTTAIEPSAVTTLTAMATGPQSIHVSWNLPLYPNSPISHYLLYHRASDTAQLPPIVSSGYVQHIVSNATEFTLTDLQTRTKFVLHVQAIGKTSDLLGLLPGLVSREILVETQTGSDSSGSSSPAAVIVGGVMGGIVALAILAAVSAVVLVFIVKRHKRAKFKVAYFSRERQEGPSALRGTTTMSNPLAFDMEECVAYIPSTAEGGQQDGRIVGLGPEGRLTHSDDDPACTYVNIAATAGPPRPPSMLDEDGYEILPL